MRQAPSSRAEWRRGRHPASRKREDNRKRASPYPQCASAAHRGYAMPSFHCLTTSIHENMWNSKSWPEGLPHQKNGVMASRQMPASSNTREIELLGKWSLAYLKLRISRRDVVCRVSFHRGDGQAASLQVGSAAQSKFHCIRKFLEN